MTLCTTSLIMDSLLLIPSSASAMPESGTG